MHSSNSLQFKLSEKQRAGIDRIQKAVSRDSEQAAYAGRLLAMLETWLLDDEQKTALVGHPSGFYYLHAAARLASARDLPEHWRAYGIADAADAQVIAKVIRRATQAPEAWGYDPLPVAGEGSSGPPLDLMAGALALAERLILDDPVTWDRIQRHAPKGRGSGGDLQPRWFRVESSGPHPHQSAVCLLCIRCRNPALHQALKHYETDVERFLNRLNGCVRPRFLFNKVRFEIQADGYDPLDFKFTVDGSAALELFMGNTLYDDKRVFLRELVQNALDACRLRSLLDPGYTPSIEMELSDTEDTLTVRDNGVGMDRSRLEKYFLNVGLSFYRSGELGAQGQDVGPRIDFISNFGIGFLSTFLVADRIVVRTRKPGAGGLELRIGDIDDYFDVGRLGDRLPIGTEVILKLRSSKARPWRSTEFLGYLKGTARFAAVPIRFTGPSGKTTLIGNEPLDVFGSDATGRNFTSPLQISPSRGCLMIRARQSSGCIFGLDKASGGISLFQDGIFIHQSDTLLPARARPYVIGRLNLTGRHRCKLSMDRNRIFWPRDQLQFFRGAVLRGLAAAAGRLLAALEQQQVASGTRRKIQHAVASFFDITTVEDSLFETLPPSVKALLRQSFRSFLRTSVSKTDLTAGNLNQNASFHGFCYRWQKSIIGKMIREAGGLDA